MPDERNMVIVRENTDGEYSAIGGRMFDGTEREIVMQVTVMSRIGVDRALKFALDLAQLRSHLLGDILSDLGPACTGTTGTAPSANLKPQRRHSSLFEPVHGSAPDIAGPGIANPIGPIWSGALMLDFLVHREAHEAILRAMETDPTPASGAPGTPDLGVMATTADLGQAIVSAL